MVGKFPAGAVVPNASRTANSKALTTMRVIRELGFGDVIYIPSSGLLGVGEREICACCRTGRHADFCLLDAKAWMPSLDGVVP